MARRANSWRRTGLGQVRPFAYALRCTLECRLRNLQRLFAGIRAMALVLDQFDNLNLALSSERRNANSFLVRN
jgi:hypothetical protein